MTECASRPETLRAVAHCKLWSLSLRDLAHVFVVCPQLRHDVRCPGPGVPQCGVLGFIRHTDCAMAGLWQGYGDVRAT